MSLPFAAEAAACRAAQELWSRQAVRNRLKPIRELRHLLVERADALLGAVAADVERPATELLGTDLLPTAAALKFLEHRAAALLKPRRVSRRDRPLWLWGCRDEVHRRPWGVVGIVGTWNYPLFLNVVQIAQALAAGNGVLWKPSENMPRTADVLTGLFRDADFPPSLFQALPATREAGGQLAEAALDHFIFTGSDAVGRKLAARLGERLIPSTLELSGCDALVVLADADLKLAARAAWFGTTLNRGQTCLAVRRIFVARERYAEFVAKLEALAATASPVKLMAAGQVEQATRLIADAAAKGEESLLRSRDAKSPERSAFAPALRSEDFASRLREMAPTIIANATPDMLICREACFAPLAAVIPFDTLDDAVSMANDSPFGLGASIFTANVPAAEALTERLRVGMATINDALAPTAHPATPFGGRGSSGWGLTQGAEGLLAMTTPQTVSARSGTFRPHYDEEIAPDPAANDTLRGLFRFTHGRGIRERLGGFWQMVKGVRNRRK